VSVKLCAVFFTKAKSKCLSFWRQQQNNKLLLWVSEAFDLETTGGLLKRIIELSFSKGQVPQELETGWGNA
jgi:hypothetical protein